MLAFVLLLAGCAQPTASTCTGTEMRLRASGYLSVATDYSYPPFAFRSNEGDLVGFDVDLLKAVAKEMKLEATFLNRGVGALVPGALAHRHDLAASGLRDSEKLHEQACVSSGYLDADLGILVGSPPPAEVSGASDLDGLKVGVLDGGRAEGWANENLDESTIAYLPTTDDLLEAVKQKQLDAIVDALPIVRFAAKESPVFETAGRIETGEEFVFATAPDQAALIERVNDALAKLRRDGTRRKLERKWFGG